MGNGLGWVGQVDVAPEAAREGMLAGGMGPEFADAAAAGQRYVAEGRNARLSGDVAAVLGRAPRTFAVWAADHRAAFGG